MLFRSTRWVRSGGRLLLWRQRMSSIAQRVRQGPHLGLHQSLLLRWGLLKLGKCRLRCRALGTGTQGFWGAKPDSKRLTLQASRFIYSNPYLKQKGPDLNGTYLSPTTVIARSAATKQSPYGWLGVVRLLRFARNDDGFGLNQVPFHSSLNKYFAW